MGGKKSTGSPRVPRGAATPSWGTWLVPGPRRTAALLAAVGLLTAGLGLALWSSVRERVLAQDEYRLDADDVAVTPRPDWVRTDVRAQVLGAMSWDPRPSILEADLVDRIAQAFSVHPWTAEVRQVTKRHPAHVDVELVYRRPVLMVEVVGGWLPVDVRSVVLPASDFAPREIERYPRLVGVRTAPLGPEGTSWGDGVVSGAARIGEVLLREWTDLGLAAIRPVEVPLGVPHSTELHGSFEIWTQGQTRIIWGHAPGDETSGEPHGPEKLARLKAFAAQQGSLDTQGSRWDLDLRPSSGLQIAPKTVRRPELPVTR